MGGSKRRGAAGMQYALIIGLLAMAALFAVSSTGLSIKGLFVKTGNALTLAGNGIGTVQGGGGGGDAGGGAQPASYRTCAERLAAGDTSNDDYEIDPDGPGGNAPITARCDMRDDGGGWTLVREYGSTGAAQVVDIRTGLAPYIDANITNLEIRIEAGITTSGRVYKRFLRNTRFVETYAGTDIYFAQCKLAWTDAYAGDDHGLNKDLYTGFQANHANCTNRTASDFRCNVLTACHRSLRSSSNHSYVAETGTYYSSWNARCGGMVTLNHTYTSGCATTHTFSTLGPEGTVAVGDYYDLIPPGRHRVWIK